MLTEIYVIKKLWYVLATNHVVTLGPRKYGSSKSANGCIQLFLNPRIHSMGRTQSSLISDDILI